VSIYLGLGLLGIKASLLFGRVTLLGFMNTPCLTKVGRIRY